MKVFISWSGPRSQHIAEALHAWLPLVLLNVDPWVSRHDIDAGARWSAELDDALKTVNYGIIVLTPGHIEMPWLMYEAGSLGKRVDASRVVPYCYDLEPVEVPSGPLSRFQGVAATEAGTRKLISGLAAALQEASEKVPNAAQLDVLFGRMWPQLETKLAETPPEQATVSPPPSSDEMVKEILTIVRGIERSREIGLPWAGQMNSDAAPPLFRRAYDNDALTWSFRLNILFGFANEALRNSTLLHENDIRIERLGVNQVGAIRLLAWINGKKVTPTVAPSLAGAFENASAFQFAVVEALRLEAERLKEADPGSPHVKLADDEPGGPAEVSL